MIRKDKLILQFVDDKIPWRQASLEGLQQLVKFASLLVFPVLIINAAGLHGYDAINTMGLSLSCVAFSSLIFALRRPIGGNCFIASTSAVGAFSVLLLAAKLGGISLVFGTGIALGLVQLLLTPLLAFGTKIFSRELAGFIILTFGIWVALLGVHELFYTGDYGQLVLHGQTLNTHFANLADVLIGALALALIIGLRLRGNNRSRILCILFGIVITWMVAFFSSLDITHSQIPITYSSWTAISPINNHPIKLAWFNFPNPFIWHGLNFNRTLILPVITSALLALLQVFAILVMVQYNGRQDNGAPNLKRVAKGNVAVGLCATLSSAIGGIPCAPNPGSFGILLTSGSFAKRAVWPYAILIVILACCPKAQWFFLSMPAAINGAAILIIGASMFTAGLMAMNIYKLKQETLFAFVIALILGLSAVSVPQFYQTKNIWLHGITQPAILTSVLTFAVLTFIFSLKKIVSLGG